MNRLRSLLGDGTVLLDGGMGTLLQEHGLDDGGSGELWNVDRPDVVAGIHEAYAAAGAGFVVVVCGDMMTMPGLPRDPSASRIDLADDGTILGLS